MTKQAAAQRWSKRLDRVHAEYMQRKQQQPTPKPLNDDKPVSIWK
jgi:hypothetical protein